MAFKLPTRANVAARATQAPRRERAARQNPIGQFVRESRLELRKVVWPTREQTTRLTLVVIGVSVAVGMLLGGFDYGLSQLFNLVAR